MKAHLFVALGQNQINNFEWLLVNKSLEEGKKILLTSANVSVNETLWDQTFTAQQSFNNNASSFLSQVIAIYSKVRAYSQLVSKVESFKNEEVVVYVCYIEDVLSNHMFFNFNKKAQAVVVEDGILNYYNHSFKDVNKIKFYIKKIMARRFGLTFNKYTGHSSGAQYPHVKTAFLTFPEHAFISHNAKAMPSDKKPITNPLNALFIIGQEASANTIGKKRFMADLKMFFQQLKKKPFYQEIDTVYYKPHRNGPHLNEVHLKKAFNNKTVKMIITPKTSEEVYFQKIPCQHIATFHSSTLPNIYSRLNKKDRESINFYVYPIYTNKLKPLFKKLNFHFLN